MANVRVEDVRTSLSEIRRLLAGSMLNEQRLYQRFSEASREADRWRHRAALAASRSADDLARAALERSAEHEARASEYHLHYLEQKAHVEAMKARLVALEAQSRLGPLPRRSTAEWARLDSTIERLRAQEGRIADERAKLAAIAELERDEVAERLAALEREDRLERELAELKSKLGVG